MSFGMIALLVLAVLLLFGVLQRVCDRMRLNDKQALLFVLAIFIGGWIPDIVISQSFSFNIGGALLPFGLCVYLWIAAGSAWERIRSLIAALVTAAALYALQVFLPAEAESLPFDIYYLYGVVAAVVSYLFGRSRRCAFIAGVLGVLLADTIAAVAAYIQGYPFSLQLGGGGAFDAVVLAGVISVLLVELFGELYEKIVRARERKRQEGGSQI